MRFRLPHTTCLFLLGLALLPAAPSLAVDVAVSGIDDELLSNVQSTASMTRLKALEAPSRSYLARLVDQAGRDAKKALEPFGLYNARVQGDITETDDSPAVSFSITPGPQTMLDTVTVRFFRGSEAVAAPTWSCRWLW